jgi:phosphoenolpyruvate-protein phosphotransferase (PTS system enzyme I)
MDAAGTGDEIVVDGGAGEVVLRPTRAMQGRYRGAERRRLKEEQALLADRELPAETTDGLRIRLMGNIEVAREIDLVLLHGGEGIGLYRTEFLIVEHPEIYTANEHYEAYKQVVDAVGGREVTIRTVDVGGDKFLRRGPLANGVEKTVPHPSRHPALGLRAIRLSLADVPRFKEQVLGIVRASGEGNVRLLLPLLTAVEELRAAKEIIESAKHDLSKLGVPYNPNIQVGVMIETPGAVWVADLLLKECDFFAIGTNDLIQYSLAVDRANEDVAHLFRPCHPAVLRMIHSVCSTARRAGKPVTICGEMAGDPFHVPLLIGLGLETLSMTATSIPLVKRLIRHLSAVECRALTETAMAAATADEVEREVAHQLRDWAPEFFGKKK